MSAIKDYVKKKCPLIVKLWRAIYSFVYKVCRGPVKERFLITRAPLLQRRALRRLKGKNTLKCVFFVAEVADWKCDKVYLRMLENPRIDPLIIVCPAINFGDTNRVFESQRCEAFFREKGYDFLLAYDFETGRLLDVQKEVKPDLIFYTDPYRYLTEDKYYITSYRDTLGVYVPYGFNNNSEFNHSYNLLFHNLLWRFYVESKVHKEFAINASRCNGRNIVAAGYPAIEGLIDGHKPSFNAWKNPDKGLKRIIWAPHHTIEPVGNFAYSCFLDYADFMLEMADKYKDKVQFVFRPHPYLRKKLNNVWGLEKTDAYYKEWETRDNTSLLEGGYEDLFLTSDAMIHDSGSFTVEYLFVNKPVLRTINDIPLDHMYNKFTLKCLEYYYFAKNQQQIEQFINDVIIGRDPLETKRTEFVNGVLMPKEMPSQIIIDDILDSIDHQILYRK